MCSDAGPGQSPDALPAAGQPAALSLAARPGRRALAVAARLAPRGRRSDVTTAAADVSAAADGAAAAHDDDAAAAGRAPEATGTATATRPAARAADGVPAAAPATAAATAAAAAAATTTAVAATAAATTAAAVDAPRATSATGPRLDLLSNTAVPQITCAVLHRSVILWTGTLLKTEQRPIFSSTKPF